MKKNLLLFSLLPVIAIKAATIDSAYELANKLTPSDKNRIEVAAKVATYHNYKITQQEVLDQCGNDSICQDTMKLKILEMCFAWLKKQELKDIHKTKSRIKKIERTINIEKVLTNKDEFTKWDSL